MRRNKRERLNAKKGNVSYQVVVATGRKYRIFPALAVAMELRRQAKNISLYWIGKGNRREQDVCRRYRISLLKSKLRVYEKNVIKRVISYVQDVIRFVKLFGMQRPDAVVAFGGAECIPVLAAAKIRSVPYYIYEYNSYPSRTSCFFSSGARHVFLGLPLAGTRALRGYAEWTGVPVKPALKNYMEECYPRGFDKSKDTILISENNDKASLVNNLLKNCVYDWVNEGFQVIWQTGRKKHCDLKEKFKLLTNCFIVSMSKDPYPYYAVSKVVVCRPDASLISELAYFGLPCILIPSLEYDSDHQWINAGVVEMNGWGIRVSEEDSDSEMVIKSKVDEILKNEDVFEKMSRKALDQAPFNALSKITGTIVEEINRESK